MPGKEKTEKQEDKMKKKNVEQSVADLLIKVYKQKKAILDHEPLEIDSLDRVEIAMWAEKGYGVNIYDDELMSWAFLSDIVETINNKIKQL